MINFKQKLHQKTLFLSFTFINVHYKMKIQLSSLLFLLLITHIHAETYTKEVNRADPQALCLDGQPSFLYYPSNTSATDGLIVYFMDTPSSPFCGNNSLSTSLDSCINAQNQFTSFWSSKLEINSGMLVDSNYKTWGKVIVPHCDGALFQGYAKNPTKYKGKDLYFRGTKIVRSNLLQITKKYNLTKLSNVVFAGSGLGAVGALTWSRYFRDQYVYSHNNLKFSLILDSYPFFYTSFKTGRNEYQLALQSMMKLSNAEESHPFLLCALRNQEQQQKCFDFEQGYAYTNFPILSVASQYDLFTIKRVLEIDCINSKGSLSQCSSAQKQYIQKYRLYKNVALFRFINFHDNSFWSVACPADNLLNEKYNSQNYVIRGVNVNSAVNNFIGGPRTIDFDRDSWPGNQNCANL